MIPVAVDVPHALEIVMVTEVQVPIAGRREVTTRSYAHVDFRAQDGAWIQRQKPCAVVVDGGRVTFPDAFVDSIPAATFPVSWTDGQYRADPPATHVGLTSAVSPLPVDAADPRVIDQDGDGQPGVTVFMRLPVFGELEIRIVQVTDNVLSGTLDDKGRISGSVDVRRLDQHTIGASTKAFARTLPTRALPGRSTFRIVPDPERKCEGAFE